MDKEERIFGITLGDVSGVGPEVLLKGFLEGLTPKRFVVYGDAEPLRFACDKLGLQVPVRTIQEIEEAAAGAFNLVDFQLLKKTDWTPCRISPIAGAAALKYVAQATRHALEGKIAGIVTLPMNKEATRATVPHFTGHTEFIADLCGNPEFTMMLVAPNLLASHVSGHVSLKEAVSRVKTERILTVIRLTAAVAARTRPSSRMAVLGLNPHAGENGAFGREDREEILPAIESACREGHDVSGPFPPDTLFMKAFQGDYDAVVCMYHDQGHIPMKLMGFHNSVNLTAGLPIVRTSVDHGTAFDIAYQGKAQTGSFAAACRLAELLA